MHTLASVLTKCVCRRSECIIGICSSASRGSDIIGANHKVVILPNRQRIERCTIVDWNFGCIGRYAITTSGSAGI
nr:MAG TPA: hypothetical protein [Caudoviricetes sp.]